MQWFFDMLKCMFWRITAVMVLLGVFPVYAAELKLDPQQIVFAGYSGKPEQDKEVGFSVAGPVYGNQDAHLKECARVGIPAMAQINFSKTIFDAPLDKVAIDASVAEQMKHLDSLAKIYYWCIQPEEVRPWRVREMEFLQIVADSIRKHDTTGRPVFHYQPNHRDANTLKPIAKDVNIVGKGCYVNSAGYKDKRAWVRWSVEQMLASMEGSKNAKLCWVMPELCKDPDLEDVEKIRRWARHDVYLGLATGAKGVLIWSLFPRKEVKKTWQQWYDAYAECARELNGPNGIAKIFLNAKPIDRYSVEGGDSVQATRSGSELEANTSLAEEGKDQQHHPLTIKAFELEGSQYIILVNSTPTTRTVTIKGASPSQEVDVFLSDRLRRDQGMKDLELEPWEVLGLKLK